MAFTASSTTLAIFGIAAATAPAASASSALIIFSTRSVGMRSMSTERGLRPSVVIFLRPRRSWKGVRLNAFEDLFANLHGFYILLPSMKEVDVQIRRAKGLEDYQAVLE